MTRRASDGTCFEMFGEASGARPTVFLIHGVGLNRKMWQWQTDALGARYQIITYDLFGHGESPPPPSHPTLTLLSNQLRGLLDDLGLSQAAVAGFSLGGMIARRFAMDHQERLSALAILASSHRRTPDAQEAIEKRIEETRRHGPAFTVEAALERWFTEAFRTTHPTVVDRVRQWVLANDGAVYPGLYRLLADGVDELIAPSEPIICPTLVMTGEEDFGNSPEMTQAIAAEIPGAKSIILSGLRHLAMMEAPTAFNEPLLSFLEMHVRLDNEARR
ncbi:MAG: alpha/beta fold hydrolase [Geminicoccaceae bacterium]